MLSGASRPANKTNIQLYDLISCSSSAGENVQPFSRGSRWSRESYPSTSGVGRSLWFMVIGGGNILRGLENI